jgi:hypothetical protein
MRMTTKGNHVRRQSRQEAARLNYPGSPLKELNDARHRAGVLSPLRACQVGAEKYYGKPRITTLQELVDGNEKVDSLCGNGDSHLLIADPYNPGEYSAKALYDYSDKLESTGVYICDVHEGRVALPPDTLIYWR